MIRRPALPDLVFTVVAVICCVGLYFMPSPPPLIEREGKSELARVVEVDNGDIRQLGLIHTGSQLLEVEIRSGRLKGKRFSAGNELRGNLELDKVLSQLRAARHVIKVTRN